MAGSRNDPEQNGSGRSDLQGQDRGPQQHKKRDEQGQFFDHRHDDLDDRTRNGGEEWALGSTQNITWNSTGLTGADSVAIQLWKSGVKLGVITTVPAVPGSMLGQ